MTDRAPAVPPSGSDSTPRRSGDSREYAGAAPAHVASRRDRQVELLPLPVVAGVRWFRRQHQAQRVDDVRARFFARATLAMYALDLRNRGDHPAVLTVFVDDRQLERLGHDPKRYFGARLVGGGNASRRGGRTARILG